MDSKLEAHIDEIFKEIPKTEKLVVMINRIKSKANAKYLQIREQGYSRNVAYTEVDDWITKAKVIVDEAAAKEPVSAGTESSPLSVENINDMPAVVVERVVKKPVEPVAPAFVAPAPQPIVTPTPTVIVDAALPVEPANVPPPVKHTAPPAAPVKVEDLSDILGKSKKTKSEKAKPAKEKTAKKSKKEAEEEIVAADAPVEEIQPDEYAAEEYQPAEREAQAETPEGYATPVSVAAVEPAASFEPISEEKEYGEADASDAKSANYDKKIRNSKIGFLIALTIAIVAGAAVLVYSVVRLLK